MPKCFQIPNAELLSTYLAWARRYVVGFNELTQNRQEFRSLLHNAVRGPARTFRVQLLKVLSRGHSPWLLRKSGRLHRLLVFGVFSAVAGTDFSVQYRRGSTAGLLNFTSEECAIDNSDSSRAAANLVLASASSEASFKSMPRSGIRSDCFRSFRTTVDGSVRTVREYYVVSWKKEFKITSRHWTRDGELEGWKQVKLR